jgi:cell division protein FtsW (lipid II flippase)
MISDSDARRGERFLAGFALLSLGAVAAGCAVAAAHSVPAGSWARNLAAWGVGGIAAWVIARRMSRLSAILLIAPIALAVTLINPGQEGVHRWIDVGPVHMNAAALLLPAAVVALAALADRRWSWLAAAGMLGLLVLQPDASQAAALGAGMIVVLASLHASALVRAGGAAATVLAVAAACLRPDPLAPVPEVEGIVALAWTWSPVVAAVAVALLAATALFPLRLAGRSRPFTPALALAACCGVQALAPALGPFPVPLLGIGMSPILGFWLGAGALAAAHRSIPPERAADA